MIIDAGAYPSPLGYGGFPKSVCTSVNECMCHWIPDSCQLQDGNIININVTVYQNVTYKCFRKGVAVCKDGAFFRKIGKQISERAEKWTVVGHGVGTVFHSELLIFHHRE